MNTFQRIGRGLLATALFVGGLASIVGSGGGGGGGEAAPTPIPNPPVNAAPTITTQPVSTSVTVPATATFNVVAAGTPTPTYQWQVSADSGVTFVDIAGAAASSYTTPPTAVADSGKRYRVVATNTEGRVTSDVATLTVGTSGGPSPVPTTCVPADVLPAGTVIESTLATTFNGVPGNPISGTLRVVGASVFQGQPAFEVSIPVVSLLPGTTRAFTNYDPVSRELTVLGAIIHLASADGSYLQDTTSVVRQPARYPLYTLSVGQSATETVTTDSTTVTTTNGVAGAPVTQTLTSTTVYTYLGQETLTTPAGTFGTCKFTRQADGGTVSTIWQMVGYGATVKFLSGGTVETLTSVSVNGTPLTHFP